MNKLFKIIIAFISIVLCINVFLYNKDVFATSQTNIYFIFSKTSFSKGETVTVDINISNYENVNEIKLGINNIESLLPKLEIDGYFALNENSIYTKELVNSYSKENGLRLHVCKESLISSYQNYFGSVKFTCTSEISNIEELFLDNITVYLFDKDNILLDYNISFSEKLNATWNVLMDKVEVYGDVPNYISSFIVKNRNKEEYELIVEENLDSSILGTQVISILVIDKVNLDYLMFYKTIEIVDITMPSINYPEVLKLTDNELNNLNLGKYITVKDNYDIEAELCFEYLTKEDEVILSFDEFIKYLRSNKNAKLKFYGVDSSLNKTDEIVLLVEVNDTTAPSILKKFEDNIIIDDYNVDTFEIMNWLEIKDNYDKDPLIEYKFLDYKTKEEITDLLSFLKNGKTVEVVCFGVDDDKNKTEELSFKIIVNDTVSPLIEGNENLEIIDKTFEEFVLKDNFEFIKITDNLDSEIEVIKKYYIKSEEDNYVEVGIYEFLEKMKRGSSGYISYLGIDDNNNESNLFIQNISVLDTTAPIIEIHNIKDGGKYLKLEEINYSITDNFDDDIEVYVKLNDYEYNNTLISKVGEYSYEIFAKDKSGNESRKIISFYIIEDNINGCSGDIDCYVDNYKNVIVVTTVLLIGILSLVITKAVLARKQKKKKIKEFKNDYN